MFVSSPATANKLVINFRVDFESSMLQAEGEISFDSAACQLTDQNFSIIQGQKDSINRRKSRFSHRSKRMFSPAGYRCTTSPTKSLSKAFCQTLVVSCHSMGIDWERCNQMRKDVGWICSGYRLIGVCSPAPGLTCVVFVWWADLRQFLFSSSNNRHQ